MDETKSSRLKNRFKILKSRVEDLGRIQTLLLSSFLGYKAMMVTLIISYTAGMFYVSVQLSGFRAEVSTGHRRVASRSLGVAEYCRNER